MGERATEVRKVAGSIPARPIIFFALFVCSASYGPSIIFPRQTGPRMHYSPAFVRNYWSFLETTHIIFLIFFPIIPASCIPNGTIAQLGERATEVRKVAGSIPARPICFLHFFISSCKLAS
ncbi:hypothetical protein N7447_005049 [Penicillium robsamsonii]|uniref:uncharacterized protein n=1 Tax=Penicillium robsamsonii TaxID=1792511 RepID=UPI002546A5C2|nr:uncharacterized protein N7447_005049 [Penicillium robsamsonii]KAJ5822709.1 hypothetical protein N7447_005049 [Penicillium robsamsonii]